MQLIRSLLYVPASSERFIAKAHDRGADAIILDLENAVVPTEKPRRGRACPRRWRAPGSAVRLFSCALTPNRTLYGWMPRPPRGRAPSVCLCRRRAMRRRCGNWPRFWKPWNAAWDGLPWRSSP